MALTVVLPSGFVRTRTAEELAMPAPWRQNNGSWLIFKHPAGKVGAGPIVRIDEGKDQAGKKWAGQDRTEHHRHAVVSEQSFIDRA